MYAQCVFFSQVNGETYKLQMLTVPSVRGSSAYSRGGSAKPPTRDISLVDCELYLYLKFL